MDQHLGNEIAKDIASLNYYIPRYSKLEQYVNGELNRLFPQYTIRHNIRPMWMHEITNRWFELDFLIEEINVALEVQGQQHYQYMPIFHGDYNGYLHQQERDELKRQACRKYGVYLYEIFDKENADAVFDLVQLLFVQPVPEHLENLLKQYGSIRLPEIAESELSVSKKQLDHSGVKKLTKDETSDRISFIRIELDNAWYKNQDLKRGGYQCYFAERKRFGWCIRPPIIAKEMNRIHVFSFWVIESYIIEAQAGL